MNYIIIESLLVLLLLYMNKRKKMKVLLAKKEIDSDDMMSCRSSDFNNEKVRRTFEEEKNFKVLSARTYYCKRLTIWDSVPEQEIFETIRNISPDTLVVLPHVSLKEIFKAKENYNHKGSREKYLQSYHVDFLICEKYSLVPLMGIELDGSYHKTESKQLSDIFKNEIFQNNNLPLLRIEYKSYNAATLVDKVKHILREVPIYCGKCGAEMVLRKGKEQGVQGKDDFFGCVNYKDRGCTYKREKDFKYVS